MEKEIKQEDGNINKGERFRKRKQSKPTGNIIINMPMLLKYGGCFQALDAIRALNTYVSVINDLKLCQYLPKY